MSTNFPTTLDTSVTLPAESASTPLSTNHVTAHQNIQDALEAVEAKVGVDSSAVATSLDYKVTNTSSSNPGHKHTLANGATDVTATAAEVNKLAGTPAGLTSTELGYVDGVTSAIQTQLNAKAATLAGTINEIAAFDSATTIASLAVATYPSKTELSYVKGVTSGIQAQFNANAAPVFKNGSITRAFNAGVSVVTTAHGLGVTPKKIRITAEMGNGAIQSRSSGTYNGTTNSNIYRGENTNVQYYFGGDDTNVLTMMNCTSNSTSFVTATATFDATNITLTYSADIGTGTFNIMWEAET